jgi:hypothetical protein
VTLRLFRVAKRRTPREELHRDRMHAAQRRDGWQPIRHVETVATGKAKLEATLEHELECGACQQVAGRFLLARQLRKPCRPVGDLGGARRNRVIRKIGQRVAWQALARHGVDTERLGKIRRIDEHPVQDLVAERLEPSGRHR